MATGVLVGPIINQYVTTETAAGYISTGLIDSTSFLAVCADTDAGVGTATVCTSEDHNIIYDTYYEFTSNPIETPKVSMLSATAALIVYKESSVLKAIVATISGIEISFGSAVTVLSANTTVHDVSMLSSTQVVVAFDNPSSSNRATAVILGISGTTITVNSLYNVNTTAIYDIQVSAISSSNFGIIFTEQAGTAKAAYGSVSGTAISYGTTLTLQATNAGASCCITALSSTTFLCLYVNGGSSVTYIRVLTVSGTSLSGGTAGSIGFSTMPTNCYIRCFSTSYALVTLTNAGSSQQGSFYKVEISGTTVSSVVSRIINTGTTVAVTSGVPTILDSTRIVYCYFGADTTNTEYSINCIIGKLCEYTSAATTTLTFGTPLYIDTSMSPPTVTGLSSTKFAALFFSGSYPNIKIVTRDGGDLTIGSDNIASFTVYSVSAMIKLSETSLLLVYKAITTQYGTAVVVSISGDTVTYNTPYTFNSSSTSNIAAEKIRDNQVIIAHSRASTSGLKAVLAYISGTTISFGTAVEYTAYTSTTLSLFRITVPTPNAAIVSVKYGNYPYCAYISYFGNDNLTFEGTTVAMNPGGNVQYYELTCIDTYEGFQLIMPYVYGDKGYYAYSYTEFAKPSWTTGQILNSGTTYTTGVNLASCCLSKGFFAAFYRDTENSGYPTTRVVYMGAASTTPYSESVLLSNDSHYSMKMDSLADNLVCLAYSLAFAGPTYELYLAVATVGSFPTSYEKEPTTASVDIIATLQKTIGKQLTA